MLVGSHLSVLLSPSPAVAGMSAFRNSDTLGGCYRRPIDLGSSLVLIYLCCTPSRVDLGTSLCENCHIFKVLRGEEIPPCGFTETMIHLTEGLVPRELEESRHAMK